MRVSGGVCISACVCPRSLNVPETGSSLGCSLNEFGHYNLFLGSRLGEAENVVIFMCVCVCLGG